MQELRDYFHENGYVRIPPEVFNLDDATVNKLRLEFEKLFQGQYDTHIYPDEIHWRPGISKENVTRELCNAWKASTVIQEVVCSEKLGKLAADIMGWESTRMGQDDVIHKPPLSNAVGFHQDGAYISDNFVASQNNCLTMWIALEDADDENGALQYAPGTHLWPYQPVDTVAASSFHAMSKGKESQSSKTKEGDHFEPLREAARKARKDPDEAQNSVQTVPVRNGEMVIHHQQLWHGSGPNLSKIRTRRALVAHLMDGQVQWRTNPPPHYIYGRYYIRGETVPREDFFPILYSKQPGIERTAWLREGMTE